MSESEKSAKTVIRTAKSGHHHDLQLELSKALDVARFVVGSREKRLTSRNVSHFGLKSVISNQIIRKYGKAKIKKVKSCPLVVPGQSIRWSGGSAIFIPCLGRWFNFHPKHKVLKVNSAEIGSDWIAISYTTECDDRTETNRWVGVDLNEAGHLAVCGSPDSGKVLKLGKDNRHKRRVKLEARAKQQSRKEYRSVRKMKEARWAKDRSHKIAKAIVKFAQENQSGIRMEDLGGIRKAKGNKAQRRRNGGWQNYQLRLLVEQKAEMAGIPFELVDPAYTSQSCSRCGVIGNRKSKVFNCENCSHFDHADVNASFNIANLSMMNSVRKRLAEAGGSSDLLKPRESNANETVATLEPPTALAWGVFQ